MFKQLKKDYVSIQTVIYSEGLNSADVHLRNYPSSRATRLVDDPSRFLLVSVRKNSGDQDDTLKQHLQQWIREGLQIDGNRYVFLGYTESHVKAGKVMFFREDDHWTVERLLENFGDLHSVYLKSGYGMYAARLGMSFSSTVKSLDVPHRRALEIPDLTAPDGSLHSDGCGMIRDSFAMQICAEHNLPLDTSVFQIRHGGIKGLLVRYSDERFNRMCQTCSSSGCEYMIAYRPSMKKYDGGPTALELNNYNAPPSSARLNFSFIVLLLTLGIPIEVFERLVQNQVDLTSSILDNRERALACIKGELDAAAETDFKQGLYEMLLAGHDMSEPTVRKHLVAFQREHYEGLRGKMHLRIHDSCYLFGVVDEDGILAANEVYINLPSRNGVLVRDVIVGRNPSYHPGDLRKLRAIDHPTLRHHQNCIVFSSKAPHSIPDTMASGDLDGDTYFVTWGPSLIPTVEAPPLQRSPTPSATSGSSSSVPPPRRTSRMHVDAVDTFMQLKFNRLLGMMANEWTMRVEMDPELANAQYTRELVPLIESALDLMKSGEDFARLESQFKRHQSRHRAQANGFVSPLQRLRDMIPQTDSTRRKFLGSDACDSALILRDEDRTAWKRFITEARWVMLEFNRELKDAIDLDKGDNVHDDPGSRFDETPKATDRVKKEYQERYFGGGCDEDHRHQRMRASAWYYYGYSNHKEAFAWLGARYLHYIKACATNGGRPPMFVGALKPGPPASTSTPLVRSNSESTLVAESQPNTESSQDVQMDVDTDLDGGDGYTTRPATPIEPPAQEASFPRRNDSQGTQRVSVTSNPKPRAPVAKQYTMIACPRGHDWKIASSNGFMRSYLCRNCLMNVYERKKDGYWVEDKVTICERRRRSSGGETHSTDEDGSAGRGPQVRDNAMGDESDEAHPTTCEREPIPARAGAPRRSSGGRTSLGTAFSDAPSSLAGLPPLRRFPARAGGDVSVPLGRLLQGTGPSPSPRTPAFLPPTSVPSPEPRTVPTSRVSSPRSPPQTTLPLVADHVKPLMPVTNAHPRQCAERMVHSWIVKWGGKTARHYICTDCKLVVKEKMVGSPQYWVSY